MSETYRKTVAEYLEAVAGRTSTPGGGAVAAIAAAEGCALISMVINFTKGDDHRLAEALTRSTESRQRLAELADADSVAFDAVMKAYGGDGDLQQALEMAAGVPLEVIAICEPLVADVEWLVDAGNKNLITDVGIAASLLRSGLESSELNVLINTGSMTDRGQSLKAALKRLPGLSERLTRVMTAIRSDLS